MTGILWTASEAANATNGHCNKDWNATGVSIDSRTSKRGDLFIALKGPKFDGHDYAAKALEKGAVAAVVDHKPTDLNCRDSVLEVKNTFDALRLFGKASRARTNAKVIGVTGSVGKTGTKEALRHALCDQGKVISNIHSYNNHWGVPLSLAQMSKDSDYGIFEIGMNHPGEITPLAEMVRPDVAIITTIEPAHIEFFNTIEEIADAKAEIFSGMTTGTAIINRDNPHYKRLAQLAKNSRVKNILSFGEHPKSDVRLVSFTSDCSGNNIEAIVCGRRLGYRLGLPGKHLVQNSLAVLATTFALNTDVAKAAQRLSELKPLPGRGNQTIIHLNNGPIKIIDETYNANPASMSAAIHTLGTMKSSSCGRRIAALGEMLELGDQTYKFHREIGPALIKNKIDLVFACGLEMSEMFQDLPDKMRGGFSETSNGLIGQISKKVRPGDIITVKGSAANKMNVIVDALSNLEKATKNVGEG
ncbi:MAG: UDP-N-acetylmuramoylalanyl-D-glutamyl-2,6-diaminopimelate--D-alanyl-D-alanine ligase [Pseudomonadota bacterium]|nr:UDP-N-acetylmuramoylalanyl-D-glutamyl-2,6-diaminopimelate--D-alanyl-D-alanine ligase [Pseudomonadota bacterium]